MQERWGDSVRKAALLSGGAGTLFGVAFSAFMFFNPSPGAPKGPLLLAIPVLTGLLSGSAGVGGTYLDRLLAVRGITQPAVRRVIAFAAIALVTFLPAALAARGTNLAWKGSVLWAMLAGLGFGAAVALIEYRLWQVRQKMLTLEIENKYLSEIAKKDTLLTEATESLVLAEERNRVARDLHDSVSSGIHGIVYAMHSLRQAIQASGPSGRVLELIALVEKTAQSTQDELRAMILELKPSLIDEKGLAEALRLHCELFSQRQGLQVDLKVEDSPGLSPEQQVAVYRIAQEALANVQKHSGATRVAVTLAAQDDSAALTVSDNGRGFTPGSSGAGGFGLPSMESRCARNGGAFSVVSSPGAGTTIVASFRTFS
ncbi:MAG: sensor histidine kinase [Bacillota bacterium]